MLVSFELISGLAVGIELFFPEKEIPIKGIVFHLAIFRLMIVWGFSRDVK